MHEQPAGALLDVLRDAGITMTTVDAGVAAATSGHAVSGNGDGAGDEGSSPLSPPLAVLYEIGLGVDVVKLHADVCNATTAWPSTPLVACRRDTRFEALLNGNGGNGRKLDGSTLKRLGFRAVADDAAQLPALLRELEERGTTGELRAPVEDSETAACLLLPEKLNVHRLRAAFDTIAALHFAADQKSAASTALAGLASIVHADRWTIYLTEAIKSVRGETALEPLAVRGLTESERELPEGDWRKALRGDALSLSGAESRAARLAVVNAETVRKREGEQYILAVPLVCGERVMGVVEAVREGAGERAFTSPDASLLSALALPVAAALANAARIAEAERLSQTDDLTKLHNARFLRQYLTSEIRRARRYGSLVSALFLDLDDFKRINDQHGHLVGSHVLMEMATVILACVRDTDVVARYGGDEFVVILPESGTEQAARVAERVRERIAQHLFTGGRSLRLILTASFGVAAFPVHAQSPQQLIAAADTAMYEAKAAHKNCIRFATADAPGA
ncbi:MAG TPA: sensor domain-containing diguanylate cyclase [Pyrinomonadaceae bacterium]|jgi:diguanylate cyclase (GGDEF)-like protein